MSGIRHVCGTGLQLFFAVKGSASPPFVFDMFYFFGRLKEGLTAFFKFTELLVFLYGCLCCHRYIAPIISYPHAHIQVRPLVDSPAGRKAVDILLCIVDRQRKGADFDVVIRVKFAICIVSGSQIPTELIL